MNKFCRLFFVALTAGAFFAPSISFCADEAKITSQPERETAEETKLKTDFENLTGDFNKKISGLNAKKAEESKAAATAAADSKIKAEYHNCPGSASTMIEVYTGGVHTIEEYGKKVKTSCKTAGYDSFDFPSGMPSNLGGAASWLITCKCSR